MFRLLFISVLLVTMSCSHQVMHKISDSSSVRSFGAIPNDGIDDTKAIQKALNEGVVLFETGEYIVSSTLYISKHGTTISSNNRAKITYKGKGSAISSKRVNGTYPVNCRIENISIVLKNENSVGIDCKLSYSFIEMVRVQILSKNSIGIKLSGDPKGTGAYYNTFTNVSVQGNAYKGYSQTGFDLTYDSSYVGRCPNANVFVGGRIGQVSRGIVIRGMGNNFYSPIFEGVTQTCIVFDHESSGVGCVSNNVYSPYIEAAPGSTATFFGRNALNCQVINPAITSLGKNGKVYEDKSLKKSNTVSYSRDIGAISPTKDLHERSSNVDIGTYITTGEATPSHKAKNGAIYLKTGGKGGLYIMQNSNWVKIQ